MPRRLLLLTLFLCRLGLSAGSPTDEKEIASTLDSWHLAAAEANEDKYFGYFAKDAVFLGTDATERWNVEQFRMFCHPYFAKGRAWNFKPVRRTISFAPDGKVAWFEEDLDTPNLGPGRGSGVLLKESGGWKIAQYNLSVPIPNPLMNDFKKRIEVFLKEQPAKK